MAAADDHQQKKNLPPIPDGAKKEEGGGNPNERTPPLPGHPLQQQPEEFDLCKNARPTERDDEGREDNDDDDDRKYAERLAECDIRRWFFGALTATDTPLTLLHEWIVGESVDLINCAATECAHKPFVPVTEGHASEWVASVVSLISDLEMSTRRDRAGDWRGGGGTDDFERVASEHSRRLPEPSDVEKARAGIPVSERANYGGEGPDKIKKMFGTRLRCASDFAPRAICQGSPKLVNFCKL